MLMLMQKYSAPNKPHLSWREAAIQIVEELFGNLPSSAWDDLLDLRTFLLDEAKLEIVVDHFLVCRQKYEADAYLPFYRLRMLLATSLTLQGAGVLQDIPLPPLELILCQRHGSLAEWKRQLEREWFEMGLDPVQLRHSQVALIEQ